ncbi:hypothetical protein SAMN05216548_11411 [Faunimonas pinastri]|uniref:Uncharacterized protein n=1 Tax=Faunimonas pinastri TaxID=1855383 RepID=A0A1H9MQV1_9HYPH|nr:hypothetical protein [Faunimonas pinastri]SER26062.1 hypothetical protein SAMN05216548_11411 [Faunimonas pinastri]
MKHLRITAKGWEGYTGHIGMVEFVDGRSVSVVPQVLADRVSASIGVVEIDEDGLEDEAGAAARIIGGATLTVQIDPLARASEADREAEQKRLKDTAGRPPADTLYTQKELMAIADDKGINGLREIAKPWGVRDRSIPGLLVAILKAQAEFVARKNGTKIAGEKVEVPVEELVEKEPVPATGDEGASFTGAGDEIDATETQA